MRPRADFLARSVAENNNNLLLPGLFSPGLFLSPHSQRSRAQSPDPSPRLLNSFYLRLTQLLPLVAARAPKAAGRASDTASPLGTAFAHPPCSPFLTFPSLHPRPAALFPPSAAAAASPTDDSKSSTPATIYIDGKLEQLVAKVRTRDLRDLRPAAPLPTG